MPSSPFEFDDAQDPTAPTGIRPRRVAAAPPTEQTDASPFEFTAAPAGPSPTTNTPASKTPARTASADTASPTISRRGPRARSTDEQLKIFRDKNPDFADTAQRFLDFAKSRGVDDAYIKSGYRTAEEQNWLHTHGYPTKGNDGYQKISPHQEARAIDWSTRNPANKQRLHDLIQVFTQKEYERGNKLYVPADEPWHMAGGRSKGATQPDPSKIELDESPFEFEKTSARPDITQKTADSAEPQLSTTKADSAEPQVSTTKADSAEPQSAAVYQPTPVDHQNADTTRPRQISKLVRVPVKEGAQSIDILRDGLTRKGMQSGLDKKGAAAFANDALAALVKSGQNPGLNDVDGKSPLSPERLQDLYKHGFADIDVSDPAYDNILQKHVTDARAVQAEKQLKQREQQQGENEALKTIADSPDKLTADIRWHFGLTPEAFNRQPPAVQRQIALKATRAAAQDEKKKTQGQELTESASYQDLMRHTVPGLKMGGPTDLAGASRPMGAVPENEESAIAFKWNPLLAEFKPTAEEERAQSEAEQRALLAQQKQNEEFKGGLRGLANLSGSPTQLLPQGAQDWINEAVAKGASGLMNRIAGVAASSPHDPFSGNALQPAIDKVRQASAEIGQRAQIEDALQRRNGLSQTAQDVLGGSVASAPAMALVALGVPAPVAFGLDGYLESTGRGAHLSEVLKETAKSATIGAIFDLPVPAKLNLLERVGESIGPAAGRVGHAISKSTLVGAGTYGVERLYGADNKQAVTSAAVNALFAGSGIGEDLKRAGGEAAERTIASDRSPEWLREAAGKATGKEPVMFQTKGEDGPRYASVYAGDEGSVVVREVSADEAAKLKQRNGGRPIADVSNKDFDDIIGPAAPKAQPVSEDRQLRADNSAPANQEEFDGLYPPTKGSEPLTKSGQDIVKPKPQQETRAENLQETKRLRASADELWNRLKAAEGSQNEDQLSKEFSKAEKAAQSAEARDYFAAGGKYIEATERARILDKDTPLEEYSANKKAIYFSATKDGWDRDTKPASDETIAAIPGTKPPIDGTIQPKRETPETIRESEELTPGAENSPRTEEPKTGKERKSAEYAQRVESYAAAASDDALVARINELEQKENRGSRGETALKLSQAEYDRRFAGDESKDLPSLKDFVENPPNGRGGVKFDSLSPEELSSARRAYREEYKIQEPGAGSQESGKDQKTRIPDSKLQIADEEKAATPASEPTPKPRIASAESKASTPNKQPPIGVPESVEEKAPEAKYKFSSTQVDLPAKDAEAVKTLAGKIPKKYLAGDGREEHPHATVKYGLHTADAADVRAIVESEPPIKAKIGKISSFPPSESSDGAQVLKLDLDSPDLRRLNKKIADALPHTDTHPDYSPHITIAYVQPGAAERYVGKKHALQGHEITIDTLTFSGKNGDTVEIPLKGNAEAAKLRRELKAAKEIYESTIAERQARVDSGHLDRDVFDRSKRILTERYDKDRIPMEARLAELEGDAAPSVASSTSGVSEPRPTGVSFSTAKGSEYVVHEDGSTTRNKAKRKEHIDSGPQPRSQKTFYVTSENAAKLGEIQAISKWDRSIRDRGDGTLGMYHETGPSAGKYEGRTIVPFETEPREGLTPVEIWKGGRGAKNVHFGNEITEVRDEKPVAGGAVPAAAEPSSAQYVEESPARFAKGQRIEWGDAKKPKRGRITKVNEDGSYDVKVRGSNNRVTVKAGEDVRAPTTTARVSTRVGKPAGVPTSDPSRNSEIDEVRARGGIKTDWDGENNGEVRWLKQSGIRGLVNETSGMTLEDMAMSLGQDGYGAGRWFGMQYGNGIDANAFLESLMEGVAGQHHYSNEKEFEDEYAEAYGEEALAAFDRLYEDERGQELTDRVYLGQADEAEENEFRELAKQFGVPADSAEQLITEGQARQFAATDSAGDASEAGSASEQSDQLTEQYDVDEEGTLRDSDGNALFSREALNRAHPIPGHAANPIASARNTRELQSHPDYKAAKAGDAGAAIRLVRDLVRPEDIERARAELPEDAIFVPLHAQEATGENAIPVMLAQRYASELGGQLDTEIIQSNRTFHTGARAMERLVTRPAFDGPVEPGKNYVLVDDVATLGGTLSEAANYIQSKAGNVAGTILLANASRTATLRPSKNIIRQLEARHGQAIREEFGVEPSALTAAEAGYLIGFKSSDGLRNRAAAARQENARRESARRVSIEAGGLTGHDRPLFSRAPGRPPTQLGFVSNELVAQDANADRGRLKLPLTNNQTDPRLARLQESEDATVAKIAGFVDRVAKASPVTEAGGAALEDFARALQKFEYIRANNVTVDEYEKQSALFEGNALSSIQMGMLRTFEKFQHNPSVLKSLERQYLTALAKATGLKEADEEQGALFQRAYHGSPHTFDKFDSSKIGTGEGAQAYGHGLYFAGKKGVADHYKRNLSNQKAYEPLLEKAADSYSDLDSPEEATSALMERSDFSPTERNLLEKLAENDWLGFDYPHQAVHAALSDVSGNLQNWAASPDLVSAVHKLKDSYGHTYEVELAPKEDEYLLWDEPLREQSEKVKQAIESAGHYDREKVGRGAANVKYHRNANSITGSRLYYDLANALGREHRYGKEPLDWTAHVSDEKAASDHLHSLGIRGIKYANGVSRNNLNSTILVKGDRNIPNPEPSDTRATPEFARAFENETGQTLEEAKAKGKIFSLMDASRILQSQDHGWEQKRAPVDYNYVIFNDADVAITGLFKRPENGNWFQRLKADIGDTRTALTSTPELLRKADAKARPHVLWVNTQAQELFNRLYNINDGSTFTGAYNDPAITGRLRKGLTALQKEHPEQREEISRLGRALRYAAADGDRFVVYSNADALPEEFRHWADEAAAEIKSRMYRVDAGELAERQVFKEQFDPWLRASGYTGNVADQVQEAAAKLKVGNLMGASKADALEWLDDYDQSYEELNGEGSLARAEEIFNNLMEEAYAAGDITRRHLETGRMYQEARGGARQGQDQGGANRGDESSLRSDRDGTRGEPGEAEPSQATEELAPQFQRSRDNLTVKPKPDLRNEILRTLSQPRSARPHVVTVLGHGGSKKVRTVDDFESETKDAIAKREPVPLPATAEELQIAERAKLPGMTLGRENGMSALLFPSSQTKAHLQAAYDLRAQLGPLHRQGRAAQHALKPYGRMFYKLGADRDWSKPSDNPGVQFASALATGNEDSLPKPQRKAAAVIKKLFDDRLRMLEEVGAPLNAVREHYFPGVWTKESRLAFNAAMEEARSQGIIGEDFDVNASTPEQRAWVKQRADEYLKSGKTSEKDMLPYLTRRPLRGRQSFRKEKVFDDIMTAQEFGLRPVSNNPVTNVMLKLAEMDRSIMAHGFFKLLRAKGKLTEISPYEKPADGWVKVADPFGTMYGPPTVTIPEFVDERVYDGLMDVAKAIGVKHDRKINIGGSRLGYSEQGLNHIVTRFATETSVLAHELGHQIDHKYGLWDELVTNALGTGKRGKPTKEANRKARVEFKKELIAIADIMVGPRGAGASYTHKKEEKIAQMMEAYIHAPEEMKQVAPKIYGWLNGFLKSKPALEPLTKIRPSLRNKPMSAEKYVGLPIMGYRVVPKAVGDILNNYLSSSLYNSPYFGTLYKGWMGLASTLNQSQLGWGSAYHAGFTTLDAQTSGIGNLIKDVYGLTVPRNRSVRDVAASTAKAITAAARNPVIGDKVLNAWRDPDGVMNPRIAAVTRAMELAGADLGMDSELRTNQLQKAIADFYSGRKLKAAARMTPIGFTELLAKPIMDMLVPRQKAGVFADGAWRIIEQNPDKSLEELAPEFNQLWNRVDGRLGQVVYDRLFMNNIAKNFVQGTIRAPGWTGGTLSELLGVFPDTARFFKEWTDTGKPPADIPDRTAYALALLLTTMGINGLLTWWFTSERPRGLDYWAFRDGGKDENGIPTRLVLPTYIKDVLAYYYKGVPSTMADKTTPAIALADDVLVKNHDYYGTEIRNPDDPYWKQGEDSALYVAKAFLPFWIRGAQQQRERGASLGEQAASFVGVGPAPAYLQRTPAEEVANAISERKNSTTRTQEEAAKAQARHDLMNQVRRGNTTLAEAERAGSIDGKERRLLEQKLESPPLVNQTRQFTLEEMMRVFEAADAGERKQLLDSLSKKIDNASKADPDKLTPEIMEKLQRWNLVDDKFRQTLKERRAAADLKEKFDQTAEDLSPEARSTAHRQITLMLDRQRQASDKSDEEKLKAIEQAMPRIAEHARSLQRARDTRASLRPKAELRLEGATSRGIRPRATPAP